MGPTNFDVSETGHSDRKRKSGCHVTTLTGFILLILALLIAVGVGVIVFFTQSKKVTCHVNGSATGSSTGSSKGAAVSFPKFKATAVKSCRNWIQGGGAAASEICMTCPARGSTPGIGGPSPPVTSPAPPRIFPRLPPGIKPTHYNLRLQPFIYGSDPSDFYFEGSVTIDVRCEDKDADVIAVYMVGLDVAEKDIRVASKTSGSSVGVHSVSYEAKSQMLKLRLSTKLSENEEYRVTFSKFKGQFDHRKEGGFFVTSYKDKNQTVYLAATAAYPVHAREVFPCFDEPNMKATFDVTLVRKTNTGRKYVTLSNTRQLRQIPISGGWVEDVYVRTKAMPTYSFAAVVFDFNNISEDHSGVTISTWTRPNAVQEARQVHDNQVGLFSLLAGWLKPPYSHSVHKFDLVLVPYSRFLSGGYWGLGLMDEQYLYRDNASTTFTLARSLHKTATVISSNWLCSLVSPEWWTWRWLCEGLPTAVSPVAIRRLHPEWVHRIDKYESHSRYTEYLRDALPGARALTWNIQGGDISHGEYRDTPLKVGVTFQMLNAVLGWDKFKEAVQIYLTSNKYGRVASKDLFTALDQVAMSLKQPMNVTEMFESWTTQGGYPVVTVTRASGGKLRLSQQPFSYSHLVSERRTSPLHRKQWNIPITYTSSENPDFTQDWRTHHRWLLKSKTLDLQDPTVGAENGWYILNLRHLGYYRVNYDMQNWNALIHQLNTNHTVIEGDSRAMLVFDACELFGAEMLDKSTAARLLDYISDEVYYRVWDAFFAGMRYLETTWNTDIYWDLQMYLQRITGKALQRIGLEMKPDSDPEETMNRVTLIGYACRVGQRDCVDMAKRQVRKWRLSKVNRIHPDLRVPLYCAAVHEGSATEWDFVYDRYMKEQFPEERNRLLSALACTQEPYLLKRAISMLTSVDGSLNEDLEYIFFHNAHRRGAFFDYVVENFDTLVHRRTFTEMQTLIRVSTSHFNTDYHQKQLYLLGQADTKSTFRPMIEGIRIFIRMNQAFLRKHYDQLKEWLNPKPNETPQQNYRLPDNVAPTHYTVFLKPNFYGSDPSTFSFEGRSSITVTCKEATDVITLHSHPTLKLSSISVKKENGNKELFQSSKYDESLEFFYLQLSQAMEAGRVYVIRFGAFRGDLHEDMFGMYLSHYPDGDQKRYVVSSQLGPHATRRVFPCFDELGMKAKFDLTVARRNDTDRNYFVISNQEVESTSYHRVDGKKWAHDRFKTTPTMATNQVTVVVCDFDYLESSTETIPTVRYRTYAYPGSLQWVKPLHEYGLKCYNYSDRLFKPHYGEAIKKLDTIVMPHFPIGGMENWGAIVLHKYTQFKPGLSEHSRFKFWALESLASLQLRMWFGNYINVDKFNYLWLYQGLVTYYGEVVVGRSIPKYSGMLNRWMENAFSVLDYDASPTSHPLNRDLSTLQERGSHILFDYTSYIKGGLLYRQMQFIMGEDAFIRGLNRLLNSHLYGNFGPSDVWRALDQEMRLDNYGDGFMTEKMDPWATQMGYPVVVVSRTSDGFRLRQQRFVDGSTEFTDERYRVAPYGYQWEIPITFATSHRRSMTKTRDDIVWLSKNSELTLAERAVNDSQAWILINIQVQGYYRVNYDHHTWQAIIDQLKDDHTAFHVLNRGHLISDAWALTKANMLNVSTALQVLEYFKHETEGPPCVPFFHAFDYLSERLETTDLYTDLWAFFQQSVDSVLKRNPLDAVEDITPERDILLYYLQSYGCHLGLDGCTSVARRLFEDWKRTGVNRHQNIMSHGFPCSAIQRGDASDWWFLLGQLRNKTVEVDDYYVFALGCSGDPKLLMRYMNMAINPQDGDIEVGIHFALYYVHWNPAGRDLAFQFFVDNYDDIKAKVGVSSLGSILQTVTRHFSTDYSLEKLELLESFRDTTGLRSELEEVKDRTRRNIAWVSDNYHSIRAWLAGLKKM